MRRKSNDDKTSCCTFVSECSLQVMQNNTAFCTVKKAGIHSLVCRNHDTHPSSWWIWRSSAPFFAVSWNPTGFQLYLCIINHVTCWDAWTIQLLSSKDNWTSGATEREKYKSSHIIFRFFSKSYLRISKNKEKWWWNHNREKSTVKYPHELYDWIVAD